MFFLFAASKLNELVWRLCEFEKQKLSQMADKAKNTFDRASARVPIYIYFPLRVNPVKKYQSANPNYN